MTRNGARPRRTGMAAALLVGLLVPVGCAWGDGEQPGPSGAQLERICAEIEQELRRRGDVLEVDVWYQNHITVPESASADITTKPGADLQAIDDEAVRLVWESRLNPLATIDVTVYDPTVPTKDAVSSIYLGEETERAPLEKKYGPHPD